MVVLKIKKKVKLLEKEKEKKMKMMNIFESRKRRLRFQRKYDRQNFKRNISWIRKTIDLKNVTNLLKKKIKTLRCVFSEEVDCGGWRGSSFLCYISVDARDCCYTLLRQRAERYLPTQPDLLELNTLHSSKNFRAEYYCTLHSRFSSWTIRTPATTSDFGAERYLHTPTEFPRFHRSDSSD